MDRTKFFTSLVCLFVASFFVIWVLGLTEYLKYFDFMYLPNLVKSELISNNQLFWCLIWSILGFSAFLFFASRKSSSNEKTKNTVRRFILKDSIRIVIISMLVFATLNLWEGTKNFFYYFSASICFILSFSITDTEAIRKIVDDFIKSKT